MPSPTYVIALMHQTINHANKSLDAFQRSFIHNTTAHLFNPSLTEEMINSNRKHKYIRNSNLSQKQPQISRETRYLKKININWKKNTRSHQDDAAQGGKGRDGAVVEECQAEGGQTLAEGQDAAGVCLALVLH